MNDRFVTFKQGTKIKGYLCSIENEDLIHFKSESDYNDFYDNFDIELTININGFNCGVKLDYGNNLCLTPSTCDIFLRMKKGLN